MIFPPVSADQTDRFPPGPSASTTSRLPDVSLIRPRDGLAGLRRLSWASNAIQLFEARMLDQELPFPCVFGVDAVRRSTLRYTLVPSGPERSFRLAEALRTFAEAAPSLGDRTSLVAFFEPDGRERSLEEWQGYFWRILQELHELDDQPWPQEVSIDPEDPEWEFSFAGMPFFVVANTPAHTRRRSRYFEYFAITFQPRFVFAGLEDSTAQGRNARKVIRGGCRPTTRHRYHRT